MVPTVPASAPPERSRNFSICAWGVTGSVASIAPLPLRSRLGKFRQSGSYSAQYFFRIGPMLLCWLVCAPALKVSRQLAVGFAVTVNS